MPAFPPQIDEPASAPLERPVVTLPGARSARVSHLRAGRGREHSHAGAMVSIYVAGRYTKESEDGTHEFAGPSVVYHPPGRTHANVVAQTGFEQVDIEFDERWLRSDVTARQARMTFWSGGRTCLAARAIRKLWLDPSVGEATLRSATETFLRAAFADVRRPQPTWLARVIGRLQEDAPPGTAQLARELSLGAEWLNEAYRREMGEGLHETVRRLRVEKAALLLRTTGTPPADIAAAVGFCDQSHMVRCFRATFGRTPSVIRDEARRTGALAS